MFVRAVDTAIDLVKRNIALIPALMAVTALLLTVILRNYTGKEFWFFTRDPTQVGGVSHYAGLISNSSVILWLGGAFVSIFSSIAANEREGHSPLSRFFFSVGVFTFVIALDDLFMIHEHFPLGEKPIFLVYLILVAAASFHFRFVIFQTRIRLALVAAVFLACSLVVDIFQSEFQGYLGEYRILFEDGFKILGASFWMAYLWASCIEFLRQ